ncbi:MAG: hypothetical protein WDO73_13385 [Ignavibacteriota bacterium]
MACNPAPCSGVPGTVLVNGDATALSSYVSPNAGETLTAISNPGWIFQGWQVGNGPLNTSAAYSVTVSTPMTVTAVFIPAKPVTLVTVPAGLPIYADGTLMSTPQHPALGIGHPAIPSAS